MTFDLKGKNMRDVQQTDFNLEVGFDGKQFLNKLLREYAKNIGYTL